MNVISPDTSPRPPKLLDQIRDRIRLKHYSLRTEQAYVQWAKRYIFFHGMRHPAEMGISKVESYLTALVVERNVTASTQSQALSNSSQQAMHLVESLGGFRRVVPAGKREGFDLRPGASGLPHLAFKKPQATN